MVAKLVEILACQDDEVLAKLDKMRLDSQVLTLTKNLIASFTDESINGTMAALTQCVLYLTVDTLLIDVLLDESQDHLFLILKEGLLSEKPATVSLALTLCRTIFEKMPDEHNSIDDVVDEPVTYHELILDKFSPRLD